jgi:L-amino acid N-acyltransferase YncA
VIISRIEIRTATAADGDRLAEVHVTAWRETYSDILPPIAFANMTVPKRTQQWREVLSNGDHPVFVAERAGQIIGFADGGPARPEEALGQEMQLYAIYLLDAAKRQGIGTKLLQSVVRQFLAVGANSACVWALRAAVPARRFYEQCGAQFAGEKLEHHSAGYDRVIVGYVWPDLQQQFSGLLPAWR